MERIILHSDFNNFYASIECLRRPDLRDRPMAVTGDAELRHGVVLSKNQLAKKCGVKTGEALWEARRKCPEIIFVPADFPAYQRASQEAHEVYLSFTDLVQPFSLDESWLDVTGSTHLFGEGKEIADSLRDRFKRELGLTVSIGVSWNKVFAKLGSDMRKPDATTLISAEDYRQTVWTLPVGELLYVGPATTKKLSRFAIRTIGDLARADVQFLHSLLGKMGIKLWRFANGMDDSRVNPAAPPPKSVGNSVTTCRDLTCDQEVKITLLSLCESVGARLRSQGYAARTLQLGIRDKDLYTYERQGRLDRPTSNTRDLLELSYRLYRQNRLSDKPIRSLAVRACQLQPEPDSAQLSLFPEQKRHLALGDMDRTIDTLREKYGQNTVQRGLSLLEPELTLGAGHTQTLHPVEFLGSL